MKPYLIAPAQLYESKIMTKELFSFLTIINICVSLFSAFTGLLSLGFCYSFRSHLYCWGQGLEFGIGVGGGGRSQESGLGLVVRVNVKA